MHTEKLCVAVLATIFSSVVFGEKEKWLPEEFPNPRIEDEASDCGRPRVSFVCDPNSMLQVSQANQLDRLIEGVRDSTDCHCAYHYCTNLNAGGTKIGVAVVREMMTLQEAEGGPPPKYKLNQRMNDAAIFAQYLDQQWKIGQCDDSVLIFYSAADHVLYTHTGEKTAETLTNGLVSEISMKHRHLFAEGEYFDGFAALIGDYEAVLRGTYKKRVYDPEQPREPQALIEIQSGAGSLAHLGISFLMVLVTLLLHL